MTLQQANKLIYELEDDEEQKSSNNPKIKIDRKLGTISYIKWGTLYNYHFSFDLKKGRLLCYKTSQSNSYNNYYSLHKGEFLQDESEIKKFEAQLQKKKNYQELPNPNNIIYVRTAKGRIFKLQIDENENYDKIVGYLQMCFSTNISNVTAFYVLLGVGIIQINNRQFKLTTGVMVSLNNWQLNNQINNGSYLQKKDPNAAGDFNLLISNIELLGGIISAFYSIHEILGLIFNPTHQTIDIIFFDKLQIPKEIFQAIFKIVKIKKKVQPSGRGQLLKLKTGFDFQDENGDYLQIAQNDHVKVFCKKNQLRIVDYALVQGSMYNASYLDDQSDQDSDKLIVNNALEYYNRLLKKLPVQPEDTKEYIIVRRLEQQEISCQSSPKNNLLREEIFEDINDENSGVQFAKSIKVHMRNSRSPDDPLQSEYPNKTGQINQFDQFEQTEPQWQEGEIPLGNSSENGNGKQNGSSNGENNNSACNGNGNGSGIGENINGLHQQQLPLEKITEQQDDEEEPDLVRASILFDEAEHNPHRDFQSIMKFAKEFKRVDLKDEYRVPQAHKKGGTSCNDQKIVELARGVGRDMISQIGHKLLSGNFNLTTISFPIRAMIPKSALEKQFMQTLLFPLYMNKATLVSNPVERLKLVIVALLSNYIQANSFLKPLNPILGETFEGGYEDGTSLYCEQISHHPPLSYFLVYGPKKSYKMFGYSNYDAKAGLNSLNIFNLGRRTIMIEDQRITSTFAQEYFGGTFYGDMKHESQGTLQFVDHTNNITCNVVLGKTKGKPADYVEGEIKQGKTVLGKLYGSYMGFLEFDGVRYWDARQIKPFAMLIQKSPLESDHTKRQDRISMLSGDMVKAQKEKEMLEDLQRKDAALRKNYQKQLQSSSKKKK